MVVVVDLQSNTSGVQKPFFVLRDYYVTGEQRIETVVLTKGTVVTWKGNYWEGNYQSSMLLLAGESCATVHYEDTKQQIIKYGTFQQCVDWLVGHEPGRHLLSLIDRQGINRKTKFLPDVSKVGD